MLVIPLWLEVYFPQDYKHRRKNTFYYSPVAKTWWRFTEDLQLEDVDGWEINKRSDLTKNVRNLRKTYDDNDLWSSRYKSYYKFVGIGKDIVFQRYGWTGAFHGTKPMWKNQPEEMPGIRYLDMEWIADSMVRKQNHFAHVFEDSNVYNISSRWMRSPDCPTKIEIDGVYRIKGDGDLYWRHIYCERKSRSKNIYRYTRIQWRLFDTKAQIKAVQRPSVMEHQYECDLTEYIPCRQDDQQTRKDKMGKLFWYQCPKS